MKPEPSPNERLAHWRGQYRQVAEALEGVPLNSIARPLLEKDLAAASVMIAHYEALVAGEAPSPD